MKICPHCGYEIDDDDYPECPSCCNAIEEIV